MRLSQLKKPDAVMTRKFAFPPESKPQDRFTVSVHYLSPALFDEQRETVRVKVVGATGKKRASEEMSEVEYKRLLIQEVLIHTVEKVEGCTIAKLRRLIPMSPEAIAASGGLEATVPMDPTAGDTASREEAQDNLIVLLNECPEFFNWLVGICTDLGNFQDEDWEAQVKNSASGPATSGA